MKTLDADVLRIPLFDYDTADVPVFPPTNLLDGARRQKGLAPIRIPSGCFRT